MQEEQGQQPSPVAAAAARQAPGSLGRWVRFAAGLLALLFFAFVVIPWLQRFGPARELKAFTVERDIDATGLFYTEVEKATEAELFIRDSLQSAETSK